MPQPCSELSSAVSTVLRLTRGPAVPLHAAAAPGWQWKEVVVAGGLWPHYTEKGERGSACCPWTCPSDLHGAVALWSHADAPQFPPCDESLQKLQYWRPS